MDNLCHTLVGAAFGECGARKTTPLATATLLIGANLPDLDVVAYVRSAGVALSFRRGWTHGVLAALVWPFVLTGLMLLWDRFARRRRRPDAPPARPRALLLLAAAAVLSHPLLDLLNTYGVRLLMPFSGRWFYGDTLFIVDPWLWLTLLAGIGLSLRAGRLGKRAPHRPARVAVALAVAYVIAMRLSGVAARDQVEQAVTRGRTLAGVTVMTGPAPVNPLRWATVVRLHDGYLLASWSWTSQPRVRGPWREVPSHAGADWALLAAATPEGRRFLTWSRFPVFVRGGRLACPEGTICLRDARYLGQSWAQVAIPFGGPVSWESVTHRERP